MVDIDLDMEREAPIAPAIVRQRGDGISACIEREQTCGQQLARRQCCKAIVSQLQMFQGSGEMRRQLVEIQARKIKRKKEVTAV
jgi:hypothetical protein